MALLNSIGMKSSDDTHSGTAGTGGGDGPGGDGEIAGGGGGEGGGGGGPTAEAMAKEVEELAVLLAHECKELIYLQPPPAMPVAPSMEPVPAGGGAMPAAVAAPGTTDQFGLPVAGTVPSSST